LQGFIDQDGSLTGKANTVMMARMGVGSDSKYDKGRSKIDPDFNVNARCTFSAKLGFYVCPGDMSWATIV
jgi:hypothetical protein